MCDFQSSSFFSRFRLDKYFASFWQAFHPSLYEIALKTLTLTQRLHESSDDNGNEDDEHINSRSSISHSQSLTLTKGLNGVLYDLLVMLKSASTSLPERSLELTVSYLIELTKLADETVRNFQQTRERADVISKASTSSLAYNAYVALGQLCNPKHASVEIIVLIIAKYLLPQLSVCNGQLPPKQMAIVRESAIHFFKTLLKTHGESVQPALSRLIQNLMIKCPERLEGRQKQAIVVIKMMNLCVDEPPVFKKCLNDLLMFSHHNKISCRIFAQEIIGKFLLELNAQSRVEGDRDTKKLLLAGVLSRCVDSSSMVRGRAIATFAEYTDNFYSPEVCEIFTQASPLDEARAMPSLEKLLQAVSGGDDLGEALPNCVGIIAMLKKRAEDERALVRRSALQALRNGVLVAENLLDQVTPIIQEHCRDSALTVRRFAIRVLTTLLEKFSENRNLCKSWVDFVVPRVFDSEGKVQEEVVESLAKLTISKIALMPSTELPWRILNELARNKMGEHLTRACRVWLESGSLSNPMIANIKSHIGGKNNIGAWMLLASISETKIITKMENHYHDYGKTLMDPSDEFLASLALRVLRNCWPSFDLRSMQRTRKDLDKYLKSFKVSEMVYTNYTF